MSCPGSSMVQNYRHIGVRPKEAAFCLTKRRFASELTIVRWVQSLHHRPGNRVWSHPVNYQKRGVESGAWYVCFTATFNFDTFAWPKSCLELSCGRPNTCLCCFCDVIGVSNHRSSDDVWRKTHGLQIAVFLNKFQDLSHYMMSRRWVTRFERRITKCLGCTEQDCEVPACLCLLLPSLLVKPWQQPHAHDSTEYIDILLLAHQAHPLPHCLPFGFLWKNLARPDAQNQKPGWILSLEYCLSRSWSWPAR